MLQDIFPHKLYNQYNPNSKPQNNDSVLIICGSQVMVDTHKEIRYPSVSELPESNTEQLIYLFSLDETKFFLYKNATSDIKIKGYEFQDLRTIREAEVPPKYKVFAAYTGKHLADWYRDTNYCGRCGTKTVHSTTERAVVCPSCKYTTYPRIMPAVIVGVKNGNRILLTKYRQGYAHNALVAGFTEIGETVEETVIREVMEETGLRVKNIKYYKSQPWGIANDILLGYYCDVDGDETIKMDESELKYADWVKREDIVLQPDSSSLTNEMMKRFKDGEE